MEVYLFLVNPMIYLIPPQFEIERATEEYGSLNNASFDQGKTKFCDGRD